MIARADVAVMTHHSFHGGMAMAMLAFSIHEGTTDLRPRERGASAKTRFADRHRRDRPRRGVGLHGHHRAQRRERHGGPAHARRAGRGGQLVRDRPEDLHHLRPRQVPLRHRPHRDGQGPRTIPSRAWRALDVPGQDVRRPARRHAQAASSRSSASRRSSATTARSTAALSFDRAPAQLIGKRGEGFKYMLVLMNNARVGVGFECIGLCEAAYRHGQGVRRASGARWASPSPATR